MPNLSKSLLKRERPLASCCATPSDALLETPHAVATAVDLHTLGHQLAEAVRPGGAETGAFLDVWTSQIMPRTIEKRDLCI